MPGRRGRLLLALLLCGLCTAVAPGCGAGTVASGEGGDGGASGGDSGWTPRGDGVPDPATVDLYDERRIVDFNLRFGDADWKTLTDLHASMPPPSEDDPKVWVHCQLEFGDELFSDAACTLKANPAYWKDEVKLQFIVRFNRYHSSGRFHGLRRMNFGYKPYAKAPIRDRVAESLMRAAGMKGPRVNHARISVNGRYYGLYENIEHVDLEFLRYQFVNWTGNLYLHGDTAETNKDTLDMSDEWDLQDLIEKEPLDGDHSRFFEQIAPLMDARQFMRFAAAERVLPTGDNWTNGSWNFYYYHDGARGLILLPNDLDTVMLPKLAPADADLYEFWGSSGAFLGPNKLLQLMFQNPAWKKAFEDDLVELRDGAYAALPAKIDEVCAQIRDVVDKDPVKNAPIADFDADCAAMKQVVADRTAYIRQRLGR